MTSSNSGPEIIPDMHAAPVRLDDPVKFVRAHFW